MEVIQKWLKDPKDYFAGVAIYAALPTCKPILLANMKKRETAAMREKLKHELKQCVLQAVNMESKPIELPIKKVPVLTTSKPAVAPLPKKQNPKESVLYHQLPAELRPSLLEAHNYFNEMCLLKTVLNDLLPEQEEEALQLQLQIHGLRKKNELCWFRIDHWKQYKKLPAAPVTKNDALNPAELVKKQQNLFSSISRLKKRFELNKDQLQYVTGVKDKTKLERAVAKQGENLLKQEQQLIEISALIDRKNE